MSEPAAVSCLLFLALLVVWLWRPRQPVAPGVWALLIAFGLLGGWALWFEVYAPSGEEPAGFAYWKPTVFYWLLAVILVASPLLGGGYPVKAIFGTYFALSHRVWRWMNWTAAAAFTLLGGVNLLVAFMSPGNWDGFKYSCMVNLLFLVLLRLNFVWLEIIGRIFVHVYLRAKAFFP